MYSVQEAIRLNLRDYYFLLRSIVNTKSEGLLYVCNSYPKSGTHLLAQIIMKTGYVRYWDDIISVQSLSGFMNSTRHIEWKYGSAPAGSLVRSHLMHDDAIVAILNRRQHRRFFIYRDPRDIVCSHANWVVKEPAIFLNKIYKEQFKTAEERIMASIVGTPLGTPLASNMSHPGIEMDFARWLGWLEDEDTFCVRFEDLVGKRGGGCENTRLEKVREILEWMGVDHDSEDIEKAYDSENMDPGESNTYKRGQKGAIGTWKEKFTDEHKQIFKRRAGDLLIRLGYENDYNW